MNKKKLLISATACIWLLSAPAAFAAKCHGNACSCAKLKVTQGYPKPPIAKVRNNCSYDVRVKITWRNHVGAGSTSHTVWSGDTDTMNGPNQYWGVEKYDANKK